MKRQTYTHYLQEHFALHGTGSLTDFLSRRNDQLYLADRMNINMIARRYGTPLEISYHPQITRQIQRMQGWAAAARQRTHYAGEFVYAYATKANFNAAVVQTALHAGAHYETSATTDMQIASYLWQTGALPPDRLILCNGSKEPAYQAAILALRQAGCTTVTPVLDDLAEFAAFRRCDLPLQFGVRERAAGNRDGTHPGNDRFGLTPADIATIADALDGSHHTLTVYHAMVGSQIADIEYFLSLLQASIESYCQLRQRVPTLRYFNFGGGMPTSGYSLGFHFDYHTFLRRLMERIASTCAAYGVPTPHLIGEFGRYTVANHSLYLFDVGSVKPAAQPDHPDWYLLNGSLMVSLPDMLMVNQEFMVLPLHHWDAPVRPVRLAGRHTCDSDDIYPRADAPPLLLPDVGTGLVLAVFGTGAYQNMLGGMGGVHHCLSPEPARLTITQQDGHLVFHSKPRQTPNAILHLLGYPTSDIAAFAGSVAYQPQPLPRRAS